MYASSLEQNNHVSALSKKDIVMNGLALAFPMFCLAIGKGYDIFSFLLYIAALIGLIGIKKTPWTRDIKLLCGCFALYFITFVFSLIFKGGKGSYLDWSSRFIYAIPVLCLLLRYPPKFKYLQWGFIIGAIIAGTVALIQVFHFGMGRAYTNTTNGWYLKNYMPIQSGDMAMTLGLISLTLGIHHAKQHKYTYAIIALLATVMGVLGSLLSGSRGGWVCVPFVLLYLGWANRHHLKLKTLVISFMILGITTVAISKIDPAGIYERVEQAVSNVQDYHHGDENTSVGIRFALWKSAIYTFEDSPIFGAGYPGRVFSREQQAKEGLFPEKIGKEGYFTAHAHNQYLEALSVRGVIGLAVLMLLFLVPAYLFLSKKKSAFSEVMALDQCGMTLIISVMGYGLTQAFFNMNSGVVFYSIMMVIIFSAQYPLKEHK